MRDWSESTFGERLDHAIEATGLTQGKFARRAELTSAAVTKLRQRRGAERTAVSPNVEKLATANGFSFEWLARGEGQPRAGERQIEHEDPVPTRPLVVAMARTLAPENVSPKVLQAAIEAFKRRTYKGGAPDQEQLREDFLEDLARALDFERDMKKLTERSRQDPDVIDAEPDV